MTSPIARLQDIERKSIARNALITESLDKADEWRGIVFTVGDVELITDVHSVVEVMDPIDCTRIPASKKWFNGIANVRGQLIPVSDLYGFLHGNVSELSNDSKIIVFRLANTVAGLIVSAVSGIRNFSRNDKNEDYPDISEQLRQVVNGCFSVADNNFPVFDFNRLVSNEKFMHVKEVMEQ